MSSRARAYAIASHFFRALDCPRSLTCEILLRYGEFEQLVKLEWDPHWYNDLGSAADSLAATKFLSKAKFLKTNIDLKKQAMDEFFACEEICRRTNLELSNRMAINRAVAPIISMAQRKIGWILGSFDVDACLEECGWGPGATFSLKRNRSTTTNKFRLEGGASSNLRDMWGDILPLAYPLWRIEWTMSNHNRVVTVPKSCKTDRTIAIEPGINLWIQKGIGKLLRYKLLKNGINLNDQGINQRKARIGAKFDHLATVDFSSASDCISRSVVEELLPRDWFLTLDASRSVAGLIDGHSMLYSKFSSMGNGFTFELESLIFFSIAFACCEYMGIEDADISVFGDDVILPSAAYDLFVSVVECLGFKINRSKSYSSTPYRESCGKHYWNGVDITPIFFKEDIAHEREVLKLANSVRRYAHRRNSYGCDIRFRTCWRVIVSDVVHKQLLIPDGFGDGGLVVNFDEATPSLARHGHEGFFVKAWRASPSTVSVDDHALLLARLYDLDKRSVAQEWSDVEMVLSSFFDAERSLIPSLVGSDQPALGNFDIRPGRHKYAIKRMLVPQWVDVGPWL